MSKSSEAKQCRIFRKHSITVRKIYKRKNLYPAKSGLCVTFPSLRYTKLPFPENVQNFSVNSLCPPFACDINPEAARYVVPQIAISVILSNLSSCSKICCYKVFRNIVLRGCCCFFLLCVHIGIYRVIRNDSCGFNNLSYTIHLR